MEFRVATIADIHFNAIPAQKMYQQLDGIFLNYLRKHKVDMVVIAGDLYDSIVSLNSKASYLSIEFVRQLLHIASSRGIRYVRILKGTGSHDNNQLTNLKIFEASKEVNFRIIETVSVENIEGMNILYLPEEYMKDMDEFYRPFFDDQYDMIFGHGMFKETSFTASKQESAVTLSGAPVFDSKKLCDICKGFCIFGHIHTPTTIRKKITYTGSFSRWVFGEEEKKGFLVTTYNTESCSFKNKFIENTLAEIYRTVTVTKTDTDHYEEMVKTIMDDYLPGADKLRVIFVLEEDRDYSLFINYLREYFAKNKQVVLKFVDKRQAIKEVEAEEKLGKLMEKYGFVFSNTISHVEKIKRFIQVRDGVETSEEKIKEILSL